MNNTKLVEPVDVTRVDRLEKRVDAVESRFENVDKRDFIACMAMQGMLAHSTRYKPRNGEANWHDALAIEAYEIADAMVAWGRVQ